MPKSFISEDDIEKSILKKIEDEHLEYDAILTLDPSPDKMDVLPDGTGRSDKKECVLPEVLWTSLKKLNPNVKDEYLKVVFNDLKADYTDTDINQTNYDFYKKIRDGIKFEYTNDKGITDFSFIKLTKFSSVPPRYSAIAVTQSFALTTQIAFNISSTVKFSVVVNQICDPPIDSAFSEHGILVS